MRSHVHIALVHFRLDVVEGLATARLLLKDYSQWSRLLGISSVYKRFKKGDTTDLGSSMEFVIKLETRLGVEEVISVLLRPNMKEGSGPINMPSLDITLLAFDNLIQMSPNLTLPYPQLHQDPLIIRCASEVWGQYEHPIYLKNLSEMSREAPAIRFIEFYMQGKTLVDF